MTEDEVITIMKTFDSKREWSLAYDARDPGYYLSGHGSIE